MIVAGLAVYIALLQLPAPEHDTESAGKVSQGHGHMKSIQVSMARYMRVVLQINLYKDKSQLANHYTFPVDSESELH